MLGKLIAKLGLPDKLKFSSQDQPSCNTQASLFLVFIGHWTNNLNLLLRSASYCGQTSNQCSDKWCNDSELSLWTRWITPNPVTALLVSLQIRWKKDEFFYENPVRSQILYTTIAWKPLRDHFSAADFNSNFNSWLALTPSGKNTFPWTAQTLAALKRDIITERVLI